MANQWYYIDGDKQIGPLSEAEFVSLIRLGVITGRTKVRTSQMHNFKCATAIKGFEQLARSQSNNQGAAKSPKPPQHSVPLQSAKPPDAGTAPGDNSPLTDEQQLWKRFREFVALACLVVAKHLRRLATRCEDFLSAERDSHTALQAATLPADHSAPDPRASDGSRSTNKTNTPRRLGAGLAIRQLLAASVMSAARLIATPVRIYWRGLRRRPLAIGVATVLVVGIGAWQFGHFQSDRMPTTEMPPGIVEDAIMFANFNPDTLGLDFMPTPDGNGAVIVAVSDLPASAGSECRIGDTILRINGEQLAGTTYLQILRTFVANLRDVNTLLLKRNDGQTATVSYATPALEDAFIFYEPELYDAKFGLPSWYLVPEDMLGLFQMIYEERLVGARAVIEDVKLSLGAADPMVQLAEAWLLGKEIDILGSSVNEALDDFSGRTKGSEMLRLLQSSWEIDPTLAPLAADIAMETVFTDWQYSEHKWNWGGNAGVWMTAAREADETCISRWIYRFAEECELGGRTAEAAGVAIDLTGFAIVGRLEQQALLENRLARRTDFSARVELDRILQGLHHATDREDRQIAAHDFRSLLANGFVAASAEDIRTQRMPPYVLARVRQGLYSMPGSSHEGDPPDLDKLRKAFGVAWREYSNAPDKVIEYVSNEQDSNESIEQLLERCEMKLDSHKGITALMLRDVLAELRQEAGVLRDAMLSPAARRERETKLRKALLSIANARIVEPEIPTSEPKSAQDYSREWKDHMKRLEMEDAMRSLRGE